MKIILSSIVKGHMYALAQYLSKENYLSKFFTSYPRWKLQESEIPPDLIETSPLLLVPYMFFHRYGLMSPSFEGYLSRATCRYHDSKAAQNRIKCNIFHGLSGHNLKAGLAAQKHGAKYICDRGSSHILFQDNILKQEAEYLGVKFSGVDKRTIDVELMEYENSDQIFVASSFAKRTYTQNGIHPDKISVIPYGVNLIDFHPVNVEKDGLFRVVYFGALTMRKGVHYLVEAFAKANIPNSQLVLIGKDYPETELLLRLTKGMDVVRTGIIPRSEVLKWLSLSSVLVLPSIEDGFGLVLLEAMACGLPVIATENTGGMDCIDPGENGFIVPIRSDESIAEKLIYLHRNPEIRRRMSECALSKVKNAGGWNDYGGKVLLEYAKLLQR